jgi:hypothetical protein
LPSIKLKSLSPPAIEAATYAAVADPLRESRP